MVSFFSNRAPLLYWDKKSYYKSFSQHLHTQSGSLLNDHNWLNLSRPSTISLRKTNKCFNCDDIAQKTYHKIFERLKNISRVYFKELIEGGRAIRFHHVDFNDERVKIMVSDFREALTPRSETLDDENTPELYQFSIGGEKRIFGFLGKPGIFYLIWFDNKHSIYA